MIYYIRKELISMIPFRWDYDHLFEVRVERLQKISKKNKWKKNRRR